MTQIQRRVFEFVRDKLASGEPAPTPREISLRLADSAQRVRRAVLSFPCSAQFPPDSARIANRTLRMRAKFGWSSKRAAECHIESWVRCPMVFAVMGKAS